MSEHYMDDFRKVFSGESSYDVHVRELGDLREEAIRFLRPKLPKSARKALERMSAEELGYWLSKARIPESQVTDIDKRTGNKRPKADPDAIYALVVMIDAGLCGAEESNVRIPRRTPI